MEQIRSRWHWGLLGPTLAIMTVISVSIINLTGCASSSYSTSYATSSSTLCQSCHGTGEVAYVAEEKIITHTGDDVSADRLKNAAATKKLCIMDAFEILQRIEEEETILKGIDKPKEVKEFRGFAEGRSK